MREMRASKVTVSRPLMVAVCVLGMALAGAGCDFKGPDDGLNWPSRSTSELGKPQALTATQAAGWGPWLSSSSMALSADQEWVYVADTPQNRLAIFDADRLALADSVDLAGQPEQLIRTPDGRVFASLVDRDQVVEIDADAGRIVRRSKVGAAPRGMAWDETRQRLYVALSRQDLVVALDPDSGRILWEAPTARRPTGLGLMPEGGSLVVAHVTGESVTSLDLDSADSDSQEAPDSDRSKLARHNAAPTVFTPTGRLHASLARAVVVSPDAGRVFVPHVVKDVDSPAASLDGDPPSCGATNDSFSGRGFGGGGFSYGSESSPAAAPTVSVYSGGMKHLQAVDDIDGASDPCLEAANLIPTAGMPAWAGELVAGNAAQDAGARIRGAAVPVAATHSATQTILAVAMRGSGQVMFYNTVSDLVAFEPMGSIQGPLGIDGVLLRRGDVIMLTRMAAQAELTSADIPEFDGLSTESSVRRSGRSGGGRSGGGGGGFGGFDVPAEQPQDGTRLFHTDGDGAVSTRGLTCDTCHPDGETDGLVWAFPDGPRNTVSLRGRVAGTEPLNWSGDTQDLHTNVQKSIGRMGGFDSFDSFGVGGSSQALAGFIEDGMALRTNPNRRSQTAGGLTSAQSRGKAVFATAACATCHGGAKLTDKKRHDLGTGDGLIDTPSLVDVWSSAPYFHDGRYKTLEALVRGVGDTMGETSSLSDDDLNDLVAYLRTL